MPRLMFRNRLDPAATGSDLLQPSDFTYQGAFKVSGEWASGGATFEYSSGTMAYNPSGNGGAGSLLMTGHMSNSLIAEVTIPTLSTAADPNTLNTAAFIGTHFVNVASLAGEGQPHVTGMVYNPDDQKVYYLQTSDYDNYDTPASSMGRFTTGRASNEGLWKLGALHPFNHARNLALVPSAWATAVGQSTRRLLNIRYRGAFAQGFNSHVWTPPASLANGGTVSAFNTVALFDDPGGSNFASDYNERNMYMGAVWVTTSSGKSSVLISGIKNYTAPGERFPNGYYGYENWVLPDECEPGGTCVGARGHRASDPRTGWWMVDPDEYAAVIGGTKAADLVDFYAFVQDFNSRMYRTLPATYLVTGTDAEMCRMTYDYVNQRMFISESFAADSNSNPDMVPVVHVYTVA